jgi:tetratricopeptide (TPR) repeat protein
MATPDLCPNCSGERTAGTCPRCLIRLGLDGPGADPSQPSEPGVTNPLDCETTRAGVLETLALTNGPLPRVLLRDTENFSGPGPIVQPGSPEMPEPGERTGRLQLFGEIARGGMGVILKGRDNDLGRDLAVKVLLERHGDDPALLRRFVEEAQIAGQLQHPGVVPIYEMGAFADQRPYFAMKLVKGRTLAEVLGERSGPSGDLPRLLAIFLDVAQTMAYTHARGVIHRDLKPSNIMVGSFGEVQVMDWGLAKVLPRGGAVDDREAGKLNVHETVIATARSGSGSGSDLDLSHAGSVLGTPSYMAPEQARGENDHLDERADVFALGSILCEILTGQPAFTGRSSGEILRQAARGDQSGAWKRLDECGAEPELIAIARDALAPEVEDRPPHAGAIADQLSRHLAGVLARVQAAERDRAVAQAQAFEERRRRKLQAALAASILALAAVGGLGGAAYLQQRQARAASVARLLGEAETLLARAAERPEDSARWREALAAAGRVDVGQAGDQIGRLERIKAEAGAGLLDAERDADLRQTLAEVRVAQITGDWAETDAAYARVFRKAGLDFDSLDVAESIARLKKRPPGVALELIGYLDHWVVVRGHAGRPVDAVRKLREITIATDGDPFRNRIRSILASEGGQARDAELKALTNDPRSGEQSGPTTMLLAASLSDPKESIAVLRMAVARLPDDFWINFILADTLNRQAPPPLGEVVRYFSAARACRPEIGTQLGLALEKAGRVAEAEATYRDLIARRPDSVEDLRALAGLLRKRGIPGEAGDLERKAALRSRPAVIHQPGDTKATADLGDMLMSRRKWDEAISTLREVIRLDPKDIASRLNLGMALWNAGKLDESAAELRETIRLVPGWPRAHNNLGYVLRMQGRLDEAIAEFREAVRLQPYTQAVTNLVEALREAARIRPDDPAVHGHLGRALVIQGRLDEAVSEWRKAVTLKPDLAPAHDELAIVLAKQGKRDEAIAEWREAIRLDGNRIGDAIWHLGDLLLKLERADEALAIYRRAREIGRNDPAQVTEADQRIAAVERTQVLLGRIDAVAKGDDRPRDAATFREFQVLMYNQRRHALAASFAAEAFADNPKLADENSNHRYTAACSALLASNGLDRNDPNPDEAARARLRRQAHDWLKAFLADYDSKIKTGPAQAIAELEPVFNLWKTDPDLACVRAPEALAKLPEAERKEWQDFWVEVDTLLTRQANKLGITVNKLDIANRHRALKQHAAAARLYAEGLAAYSELNGIKGVSYRYRAALSAAQAGSGLGNDDPKPDDGARAQLRRQALVWLKANLELRKKEMASEGAEGLAAMKAAGLLWKGAPDLVCVRDDAEVAKLPEAERREWQAFWAEVGSLIAKAESSRSKP